MNIMQPLPGQSKRFKKECFRRGIFRYAPAISLPIFIFHADEVGDADTGLHLKPDDRCVEALVSIPAIIVLDGKHLIKVEFNGDASPYSAAGRYYLRTAGEDREVSLEELKVFFISNYIKTKFRFIKK